MKLLKELIEVQGVSGDESRIKDFILNYVKENASNWKSQPKIVEGEGFQDCLILVFGQPNTAIYAHTDTIGFTTGYDKELIKVGGPKIIDGIQLVGKDSIGKVEAELMVLENDKNEVKIQYVFDREIDRGTCLSFKPDFRETEEYVQSPYMDNRLGVYVALKVAETMENGAIVFSTYEEHGGGSVGFCAKYLYEEYGCRQALISDITWVTNGVKHNGGVAISMRDSGIPRRKYLNKILDIASNSEVKYQLEVESAGGSDGTALQKSYLPIDWCFIGAPEDHVHSPDEIVHKSDIEAMISMYQLLMKSL